MLTTSLVAGGGITGGPGIMTYYYVKRWDTYVADDEGEGKRDTTTTSGRAAPARPAAARDGTSTVVVLHGDAAGRAGERGQVAGPPPPMTT